MIEEELSVDIRIENLLTEMVEKEELTRKLLKLIFKSNVDEILKLKSIISKEELVRPPYEVIKKVLGIDLYDSKL